MTRVRVVLQGGKTKYCCNTENDKIMMSNNHHCHTVCSTAHALLLHIICIFIFLLLQFFIFWTYQ